MRLLNLVLLLILCSGWAMAQGSITCSEKCMMLNDRWKVCWPADSADESEPYVVDTKAPKEEPTPNKMEFKAPDLSSPPNGTNIYTSGTSGINASIVLGGGSSISSLSGDYGWTSITLTPTLPTPERGPEVVPPCEGYLMRADGTKIDFCTNTVVPAVRARRALAKNYTPQ